MASVNYEFDTSCNNCWMRMRSCFEELYGIQYYYVEYTFTIQFQLIIYFLTQTAMMQVSAQCHSTRMHIFNFHHRKPKPQPKFKKECKNTVQLKSGRPLNNKNKENMTNCNQDSFARALTQRFMQCKVEQSKEQSQRLTRTKQALQQIKIQLTDRHPTTKRIHNKCKTQVVVESSPKPCTFGQINLFIKTNSAAKQSQFNRNLQSHTQKSSKSKHGHDSDKQLFSFKQCKSIKSNSKAPSCRYNNPQGNVFRELFPNEE